MPRRNEEDLLNPERVYYRLIKDYSDGRFDQPFLKLYRAIVEKVDPQGAQLENNPDNPPNSIKARVYTSGFDANVPSVALTIFHPLLPGHLSPPISRGEHVYVIFEDRNFSQGLWIAPVSSYHDLNLSNPDVHDRERPPRSDSSSVFEGSSASGGTPPTPADEYGSPSVSTRGNQELIDETENNSPGSNNPWEGKRVIHLGDSMVAGSLESHRFGPTPLALTLKSKLKREYQAEEYFALGRTSWGVDNWLSRRGPSIQGRADSIEDLKRRYRPDIVLITLGGNDAGRVTNEAEYRAKVQDFWNRAREGMDFAIWNGPPSLQPGGQAARSNPEFNRQRDEVNQIIRSIVGDANFIDCRALTAAPDQQQDRRRDGIHWNARAPIGEPWAQLFIDKARTL